MKLEEKITLLRKRNGWSQEELAFRLDVSRQAVSKWEMGSSVPDLDKIIKMSELFGVTTDYLLKDELAENAPVATIKEEIEEEPVEKTRPIKEVSDAECRGFLYLTKKSAKRIAFGVRLCILSPILLLVMHGMFAQGILKTESVANGVGIAALFLTVACGVSFIIRGGMLLSSYSDFWESRLVFSPQMEERLHSEYEADSARFGKRIACGVVLCILSVLPVVVAGCFDAQDHVIMYCTTAIFLFAATGVFIFVRYGMVHGFYAKLLEAENEDIYIKKEDYDSPWESAYWCFIVALYLGLSFWTKRWDRTWIVWLAAVALWSLIEAIVKAIKKNNKKDD